MGEIREIEGSGEDREIRDNVPIEETREKVESNNSILEETSRKVNLKVDNTIEDIVQYQSNGVEISFPDDEENFITLSPDDIKKLNSFNKTKYTLACGVYYQTLNLDGVKDNHKVFKPRPGFASANRRLDIKGGDPNKHYAWKRPDELQEVMYEGGKICDNPTVQTFGGVDVRGRNPSGGTTHVVGIHGEEELILTEKPKVDADARRESIEERSRQRNKSVDTTAFNELEKAGGQPFIPKTEKSFN